jgi:hypothetical protein
LRRPSQGRKIDPQSRALENRQTISRYQFGINEPEEIDVAFVIHGFNL